MIRTLFAFSTLSTRTRQTLASMQEAWKILCEREHARVGYSAPSYYPTPEHSFYSTARSVKHRASNRYSNILAYDRTAVLSSSGYLNANIVSDGRQWWVASQAPTPQTFPVFFQAIYERRASEHPLLSGTPTGGGRGGKVILVQLTGWEENGMIKADRYLSSGSFGDIALEMGEETWREDIQAKVTHFKLNELEVLHYHFEAWPDHGVPEGEDVEALRRLVLEIEEIREGEVWVHWFVSSLPRRTMLTPARQEWAVQAHSSPSHHYL